ncbi:MAG TPA: menaquinone biosynthesis decarboxylase [Bacteroidales bacterium]|jgi:4-hydroxy-3-polyprenylbenzoate decarboxylase|nr:menaquinone biosynthesis decarboxylase [Bacteroidales bacterium]
MGTNLRNSSHYCFIIPFNYLHFPILASTSLLFRLSPFIFYLIFTTIIYILMPYSGLAEFISTLENNGELTRIRNFVDPVLEIAEITDRITKNNGKALLFENNGTRFPLLINAFGSEKRMALALGKNMISDAAENISGFLRDITGNNPGLCGKLRILPELFKMSRFLPSEKRKKGSCQQIIIREPDLGILPVLKCWPHDGGRFITLPMVHTAHPVTGKTNVGMYRMQIFDKVTTGMHWQRHKTGASHYEAWKKTGMKMPVTVTLGGDPVYTYCATAPLPENISEYILAGFLRKSRIKLVKCITNDLYIPEDADIVIEGYVDPAEPLATEGPFGDHTGFYSLPDLYPVFHVTCITHSENAVYPATIVGIPPQEDAWLAKTTSAIFLPPMKLAVQPEIDDIHLPDAGVAHNLTIVRINKSYPGQGMKVINSLSGAGQMMFSKYIIVVSGDVDIRNYRDLTKHVIKHTNLQSDIVFTHGPLDVLDHSSGRFSFGGKAGIDATVKLPEEIVNTNECESVKVKRRDPLSGSHLPVRNFNADLTLEGIGVAILAVDTSEDPDPVSYIVSALKKENHQDLPELILVVDHTVDIYDYFMVTWQALGNTDPVRDHYIISHRTIMLDATIKLTKSGKFQGKWPNVVCSDPGTIEHVDEMWDKLGLGSFLTSPSLKAGKLLRKGKASVEL